MRFFAACKKPLAQKSMSDYLGGEKNDFSGGDRQWQSGLVDTIVGAIGPGCWGLPAAGVCLAAVLLGWVGESLWLRRWVGPRWRMRR